MHFNNPLLGITDFPSTPYWNSSKLWALAENYLHIGQDAYEIVLVNHKDIVVQKSTASTNLLLTILKVISYVIVVLPLAALIIKAVYRHSDNAVSILDQQSTENNDLKRQIETLKKSYELLIDKNSDRIKENLTAQSRNLNGFDLAHAVQELPTHLESIPTYIAGQEKVLTTIYVALHHLVEESPSADHIELAKVTFKKISAFLREQTDVYFKNDYENYVQKEYFFDGTRTLKPGGYLNRALSDHNAPYNAYQRHVLLIFLLKKLRRQIRICSKQDKILNKLRQSQKVQEMSNELFNRALKCLSLTWLHGTKAVVLKSACENSDGELLSAGELQRRKVALVSGEMGIGAAAVGVNTGSISGVSLAHMNTAITYTKMYLFDIESELHAVERLNELQFNTLSDFVDEGSFSRKIEALRRVQRYRHDKFIEMKASLERKLQEIYEIVKTQIFDEKRDGIFSWHDDGYLTGFYALLVALENFEELLKNPLQPISVNAENDELAQLGVVVASNNRYGFPAPLIDREEPDEEAHVGGLLLGRDIQIVFAEDKDLSNVQELLNRLKLNVQLEPMSVMIAACHMDRALARYFYDVYNLKKWQAAS